MIIVPDDPGPAAPDEILKAAVRKVFDCYGFLTNVWHPYRQAWVENASPSVLRSSTLPKWGNRSLRKSWSF